MTFVINTFFKMQNILLKILKKYVVENLSKRHFNIIALRLKYYI